MLANLFTYDVIKRLVHGYCPMENAMRAVPSHPMGHFPWDSHGNSIPMNKLGKMTSNLKQLNKNEYIVAIRVSFKTQ